MSLITLNIDSCGPATTPAAPITTQPTPNPNPKIHPFPTPKPDPTFNALKSGATSLKWDFDNDPEFLTRLARYDRDLKPEGRPQGDAVADIVRNQILKERLIRGGHTTDSFTRFYNSLDRAEQRAYDRYRQLRLDRGPRITPINLNYVDPHDFHAALQQEYTGRRYDAGLIPNPPESADPDPINPEPTDLETTDLETLDLDSINPETTDPEASDPESPNPDPTNPESTNPETADPDPTDPPPAPAAHTPLPDSPHSEPAQPLHAQPETEPIGYPAPPASLRQAVILTPGEPLPAKIRRALEHALAMGDHYFCENGILKLKRYPDYSFVFRAPGAPPTPETAEAAAAAAPAPALLTKKAAS